MTTDKITPIGTATRRKENHSHRCSRMAGKLYLVFEQLCSIIRRAQEIAEDDNCPAMREIGGTDLMGDNGLLRDALAGVCEAARCATDAAQPEEAERIKSLSKRR